MLVPSVYIMSNGAVPEVKLNVSIVSVPKHIVLVPDIFPLGNGFTLTVKGMQTVVLQVPSALK